MKIDLIQSCGSIEASGLKVHSRTADSYTDSVRSGSRRRLFSVAAALFTCLLTVSGSLAQSGVAENRIAGAIDDARRVVLAGNTHPLARAEFDRGLAPSSLPMDRMLLLLQRSPQQNAALEELLAEQQEPGSANFHAWLTPEEFGRRFGPSDADLEQVTRWLSSHGFVIGEISAGHTVIEFSGTASRVADAFHTEIHKYAVKTTGGNEQEHWANSKDPEIPEALAPVIAGLVSLNDFGLRPMHKTLGTVVKHRDSSLVEPQFSFNYNGRELYGISPYDFATMYNVTPLWNAGITGTGQSIAIVGQTDIKTADVVAFRKAFGLSATAPTIILNGTDPGTNADDQEESDLDVEWSGAVAKNAMIKFVTSASTSATAGVFLSAEYIVDKKVATIASMSYGGCEEALGTAGNQFVNSLWQQAAGEGISIFVAAGDSGSAGCDQHGQPAPVAAQYGLQINGIASTAYNVAVGGTDLADFNLVGGTNTFSTYWSTTNATDGASLKKYVPEVVWNDSCAIDNEAACNNSNDTSFLVLAGGSGGKSSCTVVNSSSLSCSGGYAKPSWQSGTGVPADGKRDIPDVSLFAGDGARGSFYLICDTSATPDGSCDYAKSTDAVYLAVGGTSASSPAMAGIQALVNQKLNAAEGNVNPTLYAMAKKESLAGCNSTNGSGSGCVFNDVTSGTSAMPCYSGTANCTVKTTGDEYGILSGYNAGTGYDLASGLGSVNATNLVNQWPGAGVAKVTLSATSLGFGNQSTGTTSAAKTVTLTNSGTATLNVLAITVGGANPSDFVESNNCESSLAASAKCTITVEFKPASKAAYSAAVSIKDSVAGSPQTIALTGTGITAEPAVTLSATSVAFSNQAVGTTSAAKTVTVTNSGTAVLSGIVVTLAGTDAKDFVLSNGCGSTLAAGAKCTLTLEFKPAATGKLAATISIKDNAAGSPQSVAVSGSGVAAAPAVSLSATSLAFGEEAKGATSAAKTVTVKNSGSAVLTVIGISLSGSAPADFVETSTCGKTLAVGATCVVTVKFKPVAVGTYSASVSIKDNAAGGMQSIALSGTGFVPAPKATLSATSVAFGEQAIKTESAARTVTLTNTGTAVLSGIAVAFEGTNEADFVESNKCAATLAINASCVITVEFKPAAAATYSATVYVKSNAAQSPLSLVLSGTGFVAAPKVTLSATAEAFGNQTLGTTSASKVVTLTNSGTATLTGLSVALAGSAPADFVQSHNCGSSIAVKGSCTITLSFKPAAVASYTATVDLKDDASGSPQTIALSGTGIKSTLTGQIFVYAGEEGISGYGGNNGAATKATLYYPKGTATDASGNLYIADSGNNVIRKVNGSTGVITTVAGNGYGAGMNAGAYSGDGGPATKAELGGPFGVTVDKAGNLYIADTYNSVIRKVTASTGIITTIVGNGTFGYSGDGGAAMQAELEWPTSVAFDTAGNIYISDSSNHVIRKVTIATGKISTIAGGGNGCSQQTDVYGDGCPGVEATLENGLDFTGTGGIAVDTHGNVFIADSDLELVREVHASNGIITIVAGTGYADANGNGGFSGDGGPAVKAELNFPTDVKVDGAGNLFIADEMNNVIREVSAATGKISTVAGEFYSSGGGKEAIPFTAATGVKFANPPDVSIDEAGNLFITDAKNYIVDKVYGIATPLPLNH